MKIFLTFSVLKPSGMYCRYHVKILASKSLLQSDVRIDCVKYLYYYLYLAFILPVLLEAGR